MLTITFALFSPLPNANAVDVAITSIKPSSGKVGDLVRVIGTINKTDGRYKIWFADKNVNETTAVGNVVNATFYVPVLPRGNYTVTLEDVESNLNATPTWFFIETAYYIKEITAPKPPKQLQENSTVTIQVNITGGESNTIYYANVSIKPPIPRNETYWKIVPLSNTTNTGNGDVTLVYPNDFGGASSTNYAGLYSIAFNKTATTTLAASSFTIGLTNATEYHRRQIVGIQAAGYHANESVTIKITSSGKTIHPILNVNATSDGLILANWTIPENASIDTTYTLNITSNWLPPNATIKTPADIQNFTVPGFNINVTTKNLAGEIVKNVRVEVFENTTVIENKTSSTSGLVTVKLEIGNYTFKAFYKESQVFERIFSINSEEPHVLYCNLTNMRILVLATKEESRIAVPGARIYLTRENKILTTDINGTAIATSLVSNASYTLNASRYGISFNVTSFPSLLLNGDAVAWYNVTFICPLQILQINLTDAESAPIANARIKAHELTGGLQYEGNTTTDGVANFNCAFGKYRIEVFDPNGIKLNETTVDLFQDENVTIICRLWGLTISVKITDYFGQPISNIKVMLQREGLTPLSDLTGSDGIAIFNNVTGGDLQALIYLFDQSQPYMTRFFYADGPTTVGIKLEKYVVLAGFLIETVTLITAMIIIASVIAVLLIEIYRRHLKQQSTSS